MLRGADAKTQKRFSSKMEGAVAAGERKEAIERVLDSNERVDKAFSTMYSNPRRARISFEEAAYREGITTSSPAYKGATRQLYDQPERFGELLDSQRRGGTDGRSVGASTENQKEAILASRQYTRDSETLGKMVGSARKETAVVKKEKVAEKSIRAGGPAYQITRGVMRSMTREIDRY